MKVVKLKATQKEKMLLKISGAHRKINRDY